MSDAIQGFYQELCEDKTLINLLTNHKVVGATTWKVHLISHEALVFLLERRGAPDSLMMAAKAMDVTGIFQKPAMGGGDTPIRAPGYISPQEAVRAARRAAAGSGAKPPLAPLRSTIKAPAVPPEDVGDFADDEEDEEEELVVAPRRVVPPHSRSGNRFAEENVGEPDEEEDDDDYEEVVEEETEELSAADFDDEEAGVFGLSNRSNLWKQARGVPSPMNKEDIRRRAFGSLPSPRRPAPLVRKLDPPSPPLDPAVDALRRAVVAEAQLATASDRYRIAPAAPQAAAQAPLNFRFGLRKEHVPRGLQQEIDLLVDAATDKGMNLLRSGVFTTSLAQSTVQRLVKDIQKYMGYLKNIKRWSSAQLSLVAYSNMTCFFDYIEFLVERGVETTELKKQTKVAININEFMCNLLALRDAGAATGEYKAAVEQLGKLQMELCSKDRREKGTKIREEVKLPSASQAVAFVERVMDKAIEEAAAFLATPGASLLSYLTSSKVRDAAMLGMAVGHVGLTVRIKAVRTAKDPKFGDTVCTDPSCCNPRCKGNLVDIQYPHELEDVEDPGLPECKLVLPHHKTSHRGIAMPTVPIESSKLCKLLGVWTKYGRPRFEQMAAEAQPNWRDPETLFISAQGKSFQGLTAWYKAVHEQHRAPYPYLPINTYRKVFVSDRLENPDRPGPSNEGAAIIMGNSVRQWHASYWPNKQQKLADGAAKDMATYRKNLLQEAGYYSEDDE